MIKKLLKNIMKNNNLKNNFIYNIIKKDIKSNLYKGKVITRFPPEPNGHLHIGHVKAICLNFGISIKYKRGPCHLRIDDTNPNEENIKFINSIKEDIKWLGFDWGKHLYYASDYFNILYKLAIDLIKNGFAYVCDLSHEDTQLMRGSIKKSGIDSPYRNRSIKMNLYLFNKMYMGFFSEGHCTLRAKIDMTSKNINLRDPIIYRIKNTNHKYLKQKWFIYPTYDFAHALSDAIENITHSLCTLEFQDHRPLYNWIIKKCGFSHIPKQIEFSRLNINYSITSKSKLKYLVDNKFVNGWDDPRMPTLKGLRRRGFTANSIIEMCNSIGISKQESIIDISNLENSIRNELNNTAPRINAVLDPLMVHIDNMNNEVINVPNHPKNNKLGRRNINISNNIYIERNDFMEVLKQGYKKLSLGGRIRLLYAYVIECYKIIKNHDNYPILIKCRYFKETIGGKQSYDKKPIQGILHWINVNDAINAEIRLYDYIFNCKDPSKNNDIKNIINFNSLKKIKNAKLEKHIAFQKPEKHFQFNRIGYFYTDRYDHNEHNVVLNKVVGLRQNWQKNM